MFQVDTFNVSVALSNDGVLGASADLAGAPTSHFIWGKSCTRSHCCHEDEEDLNSKGPPVGLTRDIGSRATDAGPTVHVSARGAITSTPFQTHLP